jgi:hypothetical protein
MRPRSSCAANSSLLLLIRLLSIRNTLVIQSRRRLLRRGRRSRQARGTLRLLLRRDELLIVVEGQESESPLADLFRAQPAIVLSDNAVALAGVVLKFLAVHDLHRATGVRDQLFLLHDTSCQAHAGPICP